MYKGLHAYLRFETDSVISPNLFDGVWDVKPEGVITKVHPLPVTPVHLDAMDRRLFPLATTVAVTSGILPTDTCLKTLPDYKVPAVVFT
ncbi:hypothetical protein L2E82_13137 [Cichorium intybus]|uniref:Uncharacterized protein n=1 Tax=Cichorium intybus TaxID=13427 RepID=A0ACB9GI00_CICIN|nr:hypothetical protein L2E82_13137 [Cichorium intybus]